LSPILFFFPFFPFRASPGEVPPMRPPCVCFDYFQGGKKDKTNSIFTPPFPPLPFCGPMALSCFPSDTSTDRTSLFFLFLFFSPVFRIVCLLFDVSLLLFFFFLPRRAVRRKRKWFASVVASPLFSFLFSPVARSRLIERSTR